MERWRRLRSRFRGSCTDVCAVFFPLTLASPAFNGLDVRERLEWVNPDVAMAYPLADGTAIALHRDVEIAVWIGVTVEQVLDARDAAGAYRPGPLDSPRADAEDEGHVIDVLGVDDPGYSLAEDCAMLESLMTVLSDR